MYQNQVSLNLSQQSIQSRRTLLTTLFGSLMLITLLSIPLVSRADDANVIELFTSHGCSSCPAADKLLAKLIQDNPEMVALEFHVDYWNQLVHGASGSWADPFSDAAFTQRQQLYNVSGVAGRKGVYTPQVIINGEYAAVGSDRRRIGKQLQERVARVNLSLSPIENDSLTINLSGRGSTDDKIWLVVYDIEKTTEITSGENKGVSITNHRIVKEMKLLDKYTGDSLQLTVPLVLAPGEGCAVLVQAELPGPVSGAANCPLS